MSAAVKPVSPQVAKAQWTPPEVQIGDIVWWFPDQADDQRPYAAIVSSVGVRSVALHVVVQNTYNFIVRDGVRHKDDPSVRDHDISENGLWTHTQRTEELAELREALYRLNKGRE